MTPGRTVRNWIASFDRARALRLQPITAAETRIVRVPQGDLDAVEEAMR